MTSTAFSSEKLKEKGNEAFKTGDFASAEKLYTTAISLDKVNAPFYFNRGLSKSKLSRFQEALTYFDRALKINPNYVKAYYHNAKMLELLNQIIFTLVLHY